MERFQAIINDIQAAHKQGLLVSNEVLTGFSGHSLIGTLQRFAKNYLDNDTCYLEVGIFQGLTLLSTAGATARDVYGIDNFAFFDPENKNFNLVKERREKLQLSNAHIVNKDYEDALETLPEYIGDKKIGVYFVDGPHDYRSQLVCLLLAKPYLSEQAIILVDDCNYPHVRQANKDFLKSHPNFKLLFEHYTLSHPDNMSVAERQKAETGWWNGINIIVRDEADVLPIMYPATPRSRAFYENEHTVHSKRFPESALLGTELAEAYFTTNIVQVLKKNWSLFKKYSKPVTPKTFAEMNTQSKELPRMHFNPLTK